MAVKFSKERLGDVNRLAAWIGANDARDIAVGPIDLHAAACEVLVEGKRITVWGSGAGVRRIARRTLGASDELPRPPTVAERMVWASTVSTAISRLGLAGQVFASLDAPPPHAAVCATVHGMTVWLSEVPARRPQPGTWSLDLPVVVARCTLDAPPDVRVGDVVTVERRLELEIGDGTVGLAAAPGAMVATVATGYVPRAMAIADDAQVELAVALGTTRLTVRQLAELAVGQVVPLGRAFGGPYEVRVAGRTVGQGELVDIDGELGVRIVSLGDST